MHNDLLMAKQATIIISVQFHRARVEERRKVVGSV